MRPKISQKNQIKEYPNCKSLVGRIVISGINQRANKIIQDHFLKWVVMNGWKSLVVVEIKNQSVKEEIKFVPCEWQSNSLKSLSYKTPPNEFITHLSRWLYDVL